MLRVAFVDPTRHRMGSNYTHYPLDTTTLDHSSALAFSKEIMKQMVTMQELEFRRKLYGR